MHLNANAAPDPACARNMAIDALHAKTAIYTRDAVVDELLDLVTWPASSRHLVDTSCGDGSFLGAALERLLTTSPKIQDQELVDRVEGWEIHSRAAEEAKARIIHILCRHGRTCLQAQAVAHAMVRTGDFLTQAPSHQRYDTVVGNPPYLRMVNVPEALRSEYIATQPRHTHHDLLHSFLEKCARCLRPGGEIAMLTSDRWLQNDTAARLRQSLGLTLGIHHLRRLDPSSACYRPKYRKSGTPPRVCPVAVVLRPHTHCKQHLGPLPVFADHGTAVTSTRTLSSMATVELGPWLGTKGVFLVDAATAATLPVACLVPAIDSRDLAAGIKAPRQYAIRTGSHRPDPLLWCVISANDAH